MPQLDLVIFNSQAFWLLLFFVFFLFFFKNNFFIFSFFFFFLRNRNISKYNLIFSLFGLFNWLYLVYVFGINKLFTFLLNYIQYFYLFLTNEVAYTFKLLTVLFFIYFNDSFLFFQQLNLNFLDPVDVE